MCQPEAYSSTSPKMMTRSRHTCHLSSTANRCRHITIGAEPYNKKAGRSQVRTERCICPYCNGKIVKKRRNARDEFDGREVWRYDFSDLQYPSVNPPAIASGTVYVAAGQQSSTYMHAFGAADGGLIFKAAMSSQWENYFAPTVGPEGVYTNAGPYGGMYGFTPGG